MTGLDCHRHRRDVARQLDAGVEASGPHDFAVHFSAVRRQLQRKRHSGRRGSVRVIILIWVSGVFLAEGAGQGKSTTARRANRKRCFAANFRMF